MAKAPAFQFYTGDWLSSTAITLMTPAEEGAYIRLLAYMWNDPDCGLPDDPEKLIALSRLTPADRGVIGSILACFEKHPSKKGFLTNKRLSEERKKQEEWRQHQREAGIKGMESRWNPKKKKHNKPITSLLPKHNPSSSSSSSSSSSLSKKEIKETNLSTFKIFYDAYPKHEAKQKALEAWTTLSPNEALLSVILEALKKHKEVWIAEGRATKHIPLPATWIRGRRWEDEINETKIGGLYGKSSASGGVKAPAGKYDNTAIRFGADKNSDTQGEVKKSE